MRYLILIVCLFAACTSPAYQDVAGPEGVRADSLAGVLRDYFFSRDYEGGVFVGRQSLNEVYTARLHAWYLINLAEQREPERALREANELIQARPDSPWGWVAAAAAARRLPDSTEWAVTASEKAIALAPTQVDARFMHCQALLEANREAEIPVFLDSGAGTPEIELCRAAAYFKLGKPFSPNRDQARIDSGYAVYARLRAEAPELIDAYHVPAQWLRMMNRQDERLALMTEALARSPHSASVRMEQGHAVLAAPGLTEEERHERLRTSIEEALRLRPDGPETIYTAIDLYGDINDADNRDRLESRLLEIEPRGPRAEWTLLLRIRRFEDQQQEALLARDSTAMATYRRMMQDYVERDWMVREGLLGEVYRKLFHATDSTTDDETLRDLVLGMAKYEKLNPHIVFHEGPIALADRGVYVREAEAVARQGAGAYRNDVIESKDYFATETEFEEALRKSAWRTYDALGWIYFKEGRLDDAESHLTTANDLAQGAVADVLWRLGQLYEERYNSEVAASVAETDASMDAETLYLTAFNYYKQGTLKHQFGPNKSEIALRSLFEKRNGSMEGFDAFLSDAGASDAAARKELILSTRLTDSRSLRPFELSALDGPPVTSRALEGRVAVINVWSTTCGPCLWEMPEIQQLHERYRDSPDVLILTLADELEAGETKRWMEEKGFTFPVMIDDGYRFDMGVNGIPHTWFIDRNGHIVYEKTGWSKYLLEEFSWRIESLRVP